MEAEQECIVNRLQAQIMDIQSQKMCAFCFRRCGSPSLPRAPLRRRAPMRVRVPRSALERELHDSRALTDDLNAKLAEAVSERQRAELMLDREEKQMPQLQSKLQHVRVQCLKMRRAAVSTRCF